MKKKNKKTHPCYLDSNQLVEISDCGGARNRTGIGTGLLCTVALTTTLRATITPHHQ